MLVYPVDDDAFFDREEVVRRTAEDCGECEIEALHLSSTGTVYYEVFVGYPDSELSRLVGLSSRYVISGVEPAVIWVLTQPWVGWDQVGLSPSLMLHRGLFQGVGGSVCRLRPEWSTVGWRFPRKKQQVLRWFTMFLEDLESCGGSNWQDCLKSLVHYLATGKEVFLLGRADPEQRLPVDFCVWTFVHEMQFVLGHPEVEYGEFGIVGDRVGKLKKTWDFLEDQGEAVALVERFSTRFDEVWQLADQVASKCVVSTELAK